MTSMMTEIFCKACNQTPIFVQLGYIVNNNNALTTKEFGSFYDKYSGVVAAAVVEFTTDRELIEDLCQQTWLEVWKSRNLYDPARPAAPWLHTIATRACRGYLRNHVYKQPELVMDSQLTPTTVEDEAETAGGSWIEEMVESPYNQSGESDTLDQLVFTGSNLSEQEAAIFNLVYWYGKSYEFVARKFGIAVGSIGPVISRLRTKLEHGMRPRNDVYRYHPPGNVWGNWSWKPDGLGNKRMSLGV